MKILKIKDWLALKKQKEIEELGKARPRRRVVAKKYNADDWF